VAFIQAHKARFGVEPICRVLTEHGTGTASLLRSGSGGFVLRW